MKTIKITEDAHKILEKIKDKINKKVGRVTFSDSILYMYELEKEVQEAEKEITKVVAERRFGKSE